MSRRTRETSGGTSATRGACRGGVRDSPSRRRDQTSVFEGLAAFTSASCVLTGSAGAEEDPCDVIESRLFPLLGVTPFIGRTFTPEEDQPNGPRAAMLSYGLWQRRFGADPAAVDKALDINGHVHTIVGVMPAGFSHQYSSPSAPRPAAMDLRHRPAGDQRVEHLPGGRALQAGCHASIRPGGA